MFPVHRQTAHPVSSAAAGNTFCSESMSRKFMGAAAPEMLFHRPVLATLA